MEAPGQAPRTQARDQLRDGLQARPPGPLPGYASAGDGSRLRPSKLRRGSTRSSQEGIHQFQSPKSFIAAGTRISRTWVASRAIATAQPRPSSLIEGTPVSTKTPNTQVMISAAEEIVRALEARPSATARSLSPCAM